MTTSWCRETHHRRQDERKQLQEYLPRTFVGKGSIVDLELGEEGGRAGRWSVRVGASLTNFHLRHRRLGPRLLNVVLDTGAILCGRCLTMIGRLNKTDLPGRSETTDVITHLRHEKEYPHERQPTRDAGEPESMPPGQEMENVATDEESSARFPSVHNMHTNRRCMVSHTIPPAVWNTVHMHEREPRS